MQEDSDGGCSTSSGAGGDRVYAEEILQPDNHSGGSNSSGSQKRGPMVVDDKKMRRQIANSNERRRMQSINAGFQSLRNQLPHHEGEKLSKVSGERTLNGHAIFGYGFVECRGIVIRGVPRRRQTIQFN